MAGNWPAASGPETNSQGETGRTDSLTAGRTRLFAAPCLVAGSDRYPNAG
ncbi:hypothetical protein [Streptomyces flavovirens]